MRWKERGCWWLGVEKVNSSWSTLGGVRLREAEGESADRSRTFLYRLHAANLHPMTCI